MDGSGFEEALSGGVKASANNVSLIPFDGVSDGMGVHAQLGLRCCGRPPDYFFILAYCSYCIRKEVTSSTSCRDISTDVIDCD